MSSNSPDEALELCARDLGIDVAAIVRVGGPPDEGQYHSAIHFLGRRGTREPTHVLKLGEAPWDPANEFTGLSTARDLLAGPAAREDAFGAVEPLGFGVEPHFLVTRFQAGELVEASYEAAIRGLRLRRPRERAAHDARRIARWLATFGAGGARANEGPTLEGLIEAIEERSRSAEAELGGGTDLDRLRSALVRHSDEADDAVRSALRVAVPRRGDCRPKNFLSAPSGELVAFDMEGFGYGNAGHDLACLRNYLEDISVYSPGARRRATALWRESVDEALRCGESVPVLLLAYLHYLVRRMETSSLQSTAMGRRGQLRSRLWLRSRVKWLGGLSGNLERDCARLREHL